MSSDWIELSKYSGAGNDFLIVESLDPSQVVPLCNRFFGVGADGVITAAPSQIADVRMRLYNADGNEASMCGNGLRCFVKYLWDRGSAVQTVETPAGVVAVSREGDRIRTCLTPPKLISSDPLILDTGVPHLITFVEDVDRAQFQIELRHRYDANLCLVEKVAPDRLKLRTFERGVEGETQACGTGAAASALAFGRPCSVEVRSKETLQVELEPLAVIGPAVECFQARVALPAAVC